MNVAVIGSSGYIANYIISNLQINSKIEKILKIGRSNADYYFDLSSPTIFPYYVLNDVDYIIFTAAISSPDCCAKEYSNCWKINVQGTISFIEEAMRRKCRIIYFSSDAVFGGVSGEICDELSETESYTSYGKMKKAVEDKFRENSYFKALRLSYVVSISDKFTHYCLECIKNNSIAEIFHPFYRNCTTITDVIDVINWLLDYWDKLDSQFLNLAGFELVSRIRIADEINRLYKGRLSYKIVYPGTEFYANRPAIVQTKSIYLESLKIIEKKTFSEAFKKELEENIYNE